MRMNRDLVKIIFECGSHDGLDTLALYNHYLPKKIYSFECNPEAIALHKMNVNGNPFITLVEKAVYNENKVIDFYATDMERSIDKNLGASSVLWHRDNKVEFFQKKIQVEAIRLDDFMKANKVEHIDLLCMDLQGAEMIALEGLGDMIHNVRYIISEVSFEHYYKGDVLFKEIRRYLDDRGFNLLIGSGLLGNRLEGWTDCLFKNKKRV